MEFDGEPHPRELRDAHGIFAWYRQQFYPGEPDGPFDWGRLFGLLTTWQVEFNEMTPRRCKGLGFMRTAERGNVFCNHPLCPSCWHRRQAEVFAMLRHAQNTQWPYLYLRHTFWVKWNESMYFPMVRLFKARLSVYRMLVYTLNMDAAGPTIDPQADEFEGELSYQLLGVFASKKLVRDLNTYPELSRDQTHLFDDTGTCRGVICREVLTTFPAVYSRWKDHLKHPWCFRRHELFPRYVEHYHTARPTGKSWCRLSKHRRL